MTKQEWLPGMATEVVALLAVKYLVIGLDVWDGFFHPGRVEPSNLNAFKKPLLGLVQ